MALTNTALRAIQPAIVTDDVGLLVRVPAVGEYIQYPPAIQDRPAIDFAHPCSQVRADASAVEGRARR